MMNSLAVWKEIVTLFPQALCAGLIIAVCCSFLGVLVVLKRLVFIGATLSQAAACGIAAAFFYGINPFWGAAALTLAAVTVLAMSAEEVRVPRDAVMAFLFIASSGAGVLFAANSANGLDEVHSLLYGDLIIASVIDLKIVAAVLIPFFVLLLLFLRPVIHTFVDREEARVLGLKVRLWELLFYFILGIIVSAASKLAGMILVFCYLVLPAAGALLISRRLTRAFFLSIFLGVAATLLGFDLSYRHNLPTNQVIVVVSALMLALIYLLHRVFFFTLRR